MRNGTIGETENLQSGLPYVSAVLSIFRYCHSDRNNFCQDLIYYTGTGSCIILKETLPVQ